MAEQLYNNVTDSLAATINSSANTLAPGTPAAWPSTGNYRIECEGEIMVVTSNDGTLLHVTRGQESTTAAAHATGATIQLIPTAGGMSQWRTELVASVSNNSNPRASSTLSYKGSASGLGTVNITVLTVSGSTLVSRTTTGVSESGVTPGLYEYSLAYSTIAPNLEILVKWDEGVIGTYTPQLVHWPAGAGSVWRTGVGVPSNSLGVDSDMYMDTVGGIIYQRISGTYTSEANLNSFSTYEAARQTAEMATRGIQAWTGPPSTGWSSAAPASQTEYACKIFLPYNMTINGCIVTVITAGSTLTSGQSLVTLYSQNGTKQGSTADQSAVWTTAGAYAAAFSGGPYSMTGGLNNYCWASILCNGTTPASFRAHASTTLVANISATGALSGANLMTGRVGTAVTAPASMTPSSLVATGAIWYSIQLY